MNAIEIGPAEVVRAMRELKEWQDRDWARSILLAHAIACLTLDDAEVRDIFGDAERVRSAIMVFAVGLQMGALLASGRSLKARRGDGTGPDAAW